MAYTLTEKILADAGAGPRWGGSKTGLNPIGPEVSFLSPLSERTANHPFPQRGLAAGAFYRKSLLQVKTIPKLLMSVALAAYSAFANDQLPAGAAEKIAAAIPSTAYAKPAKPRKLLIFSLTRGFHHASIITGKLAFTEMGRKTGAYEAVVSDDLSNFEPDRIKSFDAICFLSTTGEVFSPSKAEFAAMDDTQKKAANEKRDRLTKSLLDFVANGGGFVGIHAATDTLYGSPQYASMVNGWFDGHPWHADTPVSIKVEPGKETEPACLHVRREQSGVQGRDLPAQGPRRLEEGGHALAVGHREDPYEQLRHQAQGQ